MREGWVLGLVCGVPPGSVRSSGRGRRDRGRRGEQRQGQARSPGNPDCPGRSRHVLHSGVSNDNQHDHRSDPDHDDRHPVRGRPTLTNGARPSTRRPPTRQGLRRCSRRHRAKESSTPTIQVRAAARARIKPRSVEPPAVTTGHRVCPPPKPERLRSFYEQRVVVRAHCGPRGAPLSSNSGARRGTVCWAADALFQDFQHWRRDGEQDQDQGERSHRRCERQP